jgi:hypothetical protein
MREMIKPRKFLADELGEHKANCNGEKNEQLLTTKPFATFFS